jgi:hypothetical protein
VTHITTRLVDSQGGQRFSQKGGIKRQLTAIRLHILNLVESPEKAHLDGGVLLGVAQSAPVSFRPVKEN